MTYGENHAVEKCGFLKYIIHSHIIYGVTIARQLEAAKITLIKAIAT